MPRWDDNNVCHPKVINKSIQQFNYENNNKYSQSPKIQAKSLRREFRGHLNHKLFSENIVYDPLTVSSKPTGAIDIKIM